MIGTGVNDLKWCFLCLWVTFVDIFRCLPYEMGGSYRRSSDGNLDGGHNETHGHGNERLERQDMFSSFIHSNICNYWKPLIQTQIPKPKFPPRHPCLPLQLGPPDRLLAPNNNIRMLQRRIIQNLFLLPHTLCQTSSSGRLYLLANLIPFVLKSETSLDFGFIERPFFNRKLVSENRRRSFPI